MLARGLADDPYRAASKKLRKQLGDEKVYEAAKAWALRLCKEAKQTNQWSDSHEMSQNERQYLQDWGPAKNAALTLARHLDIGDWDGARVGEAARRAGAVLIPDSKEAKDDPWQHKLLCRLAFTKMLRELAKQPVSLHHRAGIFFQGPLLVIPPAKKFRLPKKPMSLAIALVYGFRRMSGAIERKPTSAAGRTPTNVTNDYFCGLYVRGNSYYRFDLLSGGKPCHEAATLFANLTFNTELEAGAVADWLRRNRRRVYVLMDGIKG